MKKSITAAILLIFMFLCGCSSSSGSKNDPTNYMSGTEGIRLNFVTNNPPSTIYVDQERTENIPIEIEAYNKGTYAAGPVTVKLVGFDEKIVSPSGDISGLEFNDEASYKTRFNPEGGYDTDDTTLNINDMMNSEVYDFTLKAVYCYDYATLVSVQLCVDPNPNKVTKDDACIPASVSTNGQGAPVGVSGIEIESLPGKVRAKITVKHYGQGEVLKAGTDCSGRPDRENENYVAYEEPVLGDVSGTCLTDNRYIKLRNGQGTIICTFDLSGKEEESAYKTILKMRLYDYEIKDSIQKNIKIINENIQKQ